MKLSIIAVLCLATCSVACAPSMPHGAEGPSSLREPKPESEPETQATSSDPVSTAQPEPSVSNPTLVIPLPACSRIDATEHPSLRHYCDAASAEVRSLATSAKDAVIEGAIKTGEAAQQERDKLPEQAAAARKFGGTVIDDAKDEINQLRK